MKARWGVFAVLLFYGFGLNPWFMPDQHDDVLYYFGAVNLIEHQAFSFNGWAITDWPPGLSLLLAGLFTATGASVMAAKILVLVFVAVGLYTLPRLLQKWQRPFPNACTALAALFPISFLMGTRVLSEWPFLTITVLFFTALERLRIKPSWQNGLLVGGLLAGAALTRYIGVFLGAAIVWQWFLAVRKDGFSLRPCWRPEVLAAGIGAGSWVAWRMRCDAMIKQGLAEEGNYAQAGYFAERFTNLEPIRFFVRIEEMMFSLGRVAGSLGLPDAIGVGIALLLGGVMVAGFILHLKKRGLQPVDAYVLVCLVLLLLDLKKPERYFMPLAPFLCSYVLETWHRLTIESGVIRSKRLSVVVLAGWMAWLGLLNAMLLAKGNMSGTHGGLSMLVSKSPQTFYQGEWLDLYQACRYLDEHAESRTIAVHAEVIGKYVRAFGGQPYLQLPWDLGKPYDLVLTEVDGERLPDYQGWRTLKTFGPYVILEKPDA